MASEKVLGQLENVKADLSRLSQSPQFQQVVNFPEANQVFTSAQDLALKWAGRIERTKAKLEDVSIEPLVTYIDRIAAIVDRRQIQPNETIVTALRRAKSEFESRIPVLSLDVIEASGIIDAPETVDAAKVAALFEIQSLKEEAGDTIKSTAAALEAHIKMTAEEAVKDYEAAKEAASRIVVDSAEQQFITAKTHLRNRAIIWTALTVIQFLALIGLLLWMYSHPSLIIAEIEKAMLQNNANKATLSGSVPLLIAASAYFTAIRLAIVTVLGIGLAVSLRMMRAYFHMIEHNDHKLRVTNSIEAFVAAVRTKEHKDLVLGKLVESVTDFGDAGILGKQTETSTLPSVVLEAITKNVGKAE